VEAPDVTGCRGISCSEHFPGQLAVVRAPPPPSGVGTTARHHRASPQGAELTARDITFSGLRRRVVFNALGVALAAYRLPTPGLVGSPHVHSSCLVPVRRLAGFLIKCLHVHWKSLPQCRFAWPLPRRVDFPSRRLLFPVFSLSLCQFLCIIMSVAQLRFDTAISRRLGHIRPGAPPLTSAFPMCLFVGSAPQYFPCLHLCMWRSPAFYFQYDVHVLYKF
jgi:hypothetical protein